MPNYKKVEAARRSKEKRRAKNLYLICFGVPVILIALYLFLGAKP